MPPKLTITYISMISAGSCRQDTRKMQHVSSTLPAMHGECLTQSTQLELVGHSIVSSIDAILESSLSCYKNYCAFIPRFKVPSNPHHPAPTKKDKVKLQFCILLNNFLCFLIYCCRLVHQILIRIHIMEE